MQVFEASHVVGIKDMIVVKIWSERLRNWVADGVCLRRGSLLPKKIRLWLRKASEATGTSPSVNHKTDKLLNSVGKALEIARQPNHYKSSDLLPNLFRDEYHHSLGSNAIGVAHPLTQTTQRHTQTLLCE